MEDFLKDRPVHVAAAADESPEVSESTAESPFSPIQHLNTEGPAADVPRNSRAESPAGEAACDASGASVRAVVERGRVRKIIVTCSCGKVTEVDCVY